MEVDFTSSSLHSSSQTPDKMLYLFLLEHPSSSEHQAMWSACSHTAIPAKPFLRLWARRGLGCTALQPQVRLVLQPACLHEHQHRHWVHQNNTNYLNNHLMGLNSEADSIVAREFLTLEDALWWSGRLLGSLTFRMISKACMCIDAFAWRCWWWFIHLYWGHVEGAHSVETSQYVLILLLSLYTCQEL